MLAVAGPAIAVAGRFTVRPLARLATRAQLQRDLVVAATEAERARLAADIHDDALQELTLLVRRLEAAGDTEGAELARTVADRLRAICGDLRLPILDDLGVGPALDWLVLRIERLAGGEVRLERTDGTRPPPDVELAIFRVAQEALANAVKHGQPPIVVRYRATRSPARRCRSTTPGPGSPRTPARPPSGAALRAAEHAAAGRADRGDPRHPALAERRDPRRAGVAAALTSERRRTARSAIAIVDDHPVAARGDRGAARRPARDLEVVGTAGVARRGATRSLASAPVDVVLLDIRLGTDSGLRC